MADGKLIFDTGLDDSGVTSDVGKLKGTFMSAFSKIGAVIGSALVIGKVKDFVTQSISLASNLAEVQNVVDVAFGSSASTINDWAKKASEAYGLTELQAKQYTSTMGAMLKSSGLSGDAIVGMSEDLAGLTADFASFYNLDHEDAFEKIRSGISGETEPLKQLGINMSVANLEAYALSEGITKSYNSMTQAEQTTLRYNYLMSVTADAQGDFARTSDGYANQTRLLSNNISDLSANFGSKLLPAVNNVVKALNDKLTSTKAEDAFDKIGDAAANATEKIGDFVIGIVDNSGKIVAAGKAIVTAFVLTKAVKGITTLMTAVKTASTVVDTFVVANDLMKISTVAAATATVGAAKGMSVFQLAVGVLTGKVTLATAAQAALNATILANPYVAVVAAIGIAVTALAVFCNSLDDTKTKTDEINDAIDENAGKLEESTAAYYDLIDAQNEAMETGVGEINYYQSLKNELDGIVDANGKVKEGYEDRAAFIVNQLSDATGTEISLIDGVISGYNELSGTIDTYLEKRKAQLIVEAQEDAYKDAISNIDSYVQESTDAYNNMIAARENYNDLMSQTINKGNYQHLTAEREKAADTLATAEESYDKYKQLVSDALTTISQYETDYANLTQGNIDDIIAAHSAISSSLVDVTTATKDELEEQKATLEQEMSAMKQIYEDTGNDQVQTVIDDLQEQLDATNDALDAMNSTVETKGAEQTTTWQALGYDSVEAYTQAVLAGEVTAEEVAAAVADGAVEGVGSENGEGGGFNASGQDAGNSYQTGIESTTQNIQDAAAALAAAGGQSADEQEPSYQNAGDNAGSSYAASLLAGAPGASASGTSVAGAGVTGADSQQNGFAAAGANGSLNISTGILSKSDTVSNSAQSVATAAKDAAAAVNTEPAGASFVDGIISGIGSGLRRLKEAAKNTVMSAYYAAKDWLQSHSPSKRTEKGLGIPFVQGPEVGIKKETPKLMATAKESMQKAVAAAKSAINEAQISTSLSITPAVISSGSNPAGDTNTVYQTINYSSDQATPSDVKRAARRGAKQGLAGGI